MTDAWNTIPKVLIAYPSPGSAHGISESWMEAMFALRTNYAIIATAENKTNSIIYPSTASVSGMPWDAARNKCVSSMMEGEYDYILFIDTDVIVPPDLIKRLTHHNLDIVGLSYKQKFPPHNFCAFKKSQDVHGLDTKIPIVPTGELVEVDYIGTGCLLISRKVFQKMAFPWFKWTVDVTTPNGQSEDFYFCSKAQEAGFKIWWDSALPQAGHVVTALLTSDGFTQVH